MHLTSTVLFSSVLVGRSLALTVKVPRQLSGDAPQGFRASAPRRDAKAPSHVQRSEGAVVGYFDGGGWTLPVLIGGQQVILNIDTGSSDLWTASTLMPPDQQKTVTSGALYDPSKSSTYKPVDGFTYDLGYGDGSGSSGPVGTDSVNIGGAIVPKMDFGVCNNLRYGSGEKHRDTDGPVGLGFGKENSIRPTPQCTFMECLEPYVPEKIFCTKLTLDDSGFIDFGFSDAAAQTGPQTTIPISNTTADHVGQWVSEGVQFGSGTKTFPSGPVDLGFDLGTSTLNLPTAAAAAYFGLVPGSSDSSGSWQYPCGSKLPDLNFIFSKVTNGPKIVTIPGKNVANGGGTTGMCGTHIATSDGYSNAGIPFYISKYMIWNQQLPSLAFANQK